MICKFMDAQSKLICKYKGTVTKINTIYEIQGVRILHMIYRRWKNATINNPRTY